MSNDVRGKPGARLPSVAGYALRWQGDVLVIQPDCWCDPHLATPEQYARRQIIVDVMPSIRPRAIVLNLRGVRIMPAAITTLVVRLGKLVDFTRAEGRLAIVECDPAIREYFRSNQLDRFIKFFATERDICQTQSVA